MVDKYSPEQGDIIMLDFDPQSDHEQKGKRPAFIASNKDFHNLTNLAILYPITSIKRGFPLHVPLDEQTTTTGVIMCEQVKSLDLKARKATYVEKAPRHITDEVFDTLYGSLEKLI